MGGYHKTGPSGAGVAFLVVILFWGFLAFVALGAH
jgi:hypothetical protein